MKIYKYFCIDNNPSLLPDKGMLLRNKGMLLHNEYKTMTNDRWQFQNNAHHTTCPAVIFIFMIISIYYYYI